MPEDVEGSDRKPTLDSEARTDAEGNKPAAEGRPEYRASIMEGPEATKPFVEGNKVWCKQNDIKTAMVVTKMGINRETNKWQYQLKYVDPQGEEHSDGQWVAHSKLRDRGKK